MTFLVLLSRGKFTYPQCITRLNDTDTKTADSPPQLDNFGPNASLPQCCRKSETTDASSYNQN
jgi:hypothetical protein